MCVEVNAQSKYSELLLNTLNLGPTVRGEEYMILKISRVVHIRPSQVFYFLKWERKLSSKLVYSLLWGRYYAPL